MARKSVGLWLGFLGLLVLSFHAQAYEEVVVANGGMIKGTVKIQGTPPKLPTFPVTKFKDVCKTFPNETLVIGPKQGVRYAVVTLEGIAKGKAFEKEAVHELDNVSCRFVPHVQAASVGQFLLIKNSDPILHTAHAYFGGGEGFHAPPQPQFNVGLYPGKTSRKPLVSPGVAKILCEVHPWMIAYVVVTDHPYHAVTDIYGEYEIRDVPTGNYRLKVWHESLGIQEKQVEVKGGAVSNVDFLLAATLGAKIGAKK